MKNDKALIFVVDDSRYTLAQAKQSLLKAFDCNIFTFKTGEECLEYINEKPDIVVLDYYLNGEEANAMNGIQVLKKIKEISSDIKVVMLSAQDKVEIAVDCLKHGAYEYITKSETAYIKLANTLKNINYNIIGKQNKNKYEKWNYIFAFAFIVMLIINLMVYYHASK